MKLKSFLFRSVGRMWYFKKNKDIEPPIFIVGSHRSGTTLLSNILSQPDDVINWSEANYIWEPHYYNPLTLKKSFIPDFSGRGRGIHSHEITKFDRNYVEKRVKNYFSFYSFIHGDKRILQQNPYNSLRLEEIVDWFPNCRIIGLIRDVRAVVNSHFKRYGPHYNFDEDAVIYKWELFRKKLQNIKEKYPNQVAEISYRSMSDDNAHKMFSSLFKFCCLEYKKDYIKNMSIENRNYKYKKNLSNSTIKRIEDSVKEVQPHPLGIKN